MTWANVIATGQGAVALRLEIAGHPIEFVTAEYLAGASTDGRTRMAGLNINNINWGEEINPTTVTMTQHGFTAQIIDSYDHSISNSFFQYPNELKYNYLTASIDDSITMIPVINGNTGVDDVIYLGQECMLVTNVFYTPPNVYVNEVIRGYRHSQVQYHYVDSTLGIGQPEITNCRLSVESQTVYIYAYGDGETGDGTLIWTGVISTQPVMRSLNTIEIAIDGVTSILDQGLGTDLKAISMPRGITYENFSAPKIIINMMSSYTHYAGTSLNEYTIPAEDLAGHYESQEEWCDHVNSLIVAATTAWTYPLLNPDSGIGPYLKATPGASNQDSWGFIYRTGGTPKWLTVDVEDTTEDGFIDAIQGSHENFYDTSSPPAIITTVLANTSYKIPSSDLNWLGPTVSPLVGPVIDGAGSVPRGYIGRPPTSGYILWAETFMPNDSSVILIPGTDQVLIEWPAFTGFEKQTQTYEVLAYDSGTHIATIHNPFSFTTSFGRRYTATILPKVKISRMYVRSGNVADMILSIIGSSPKEAPHGSQPFVTSQHIDTSNLSLAVNDATDGHAWAMNRYYGGTSDLSLQKLLIEEYKLIGVVPTIKSDGRMSLIKFRIGASTEASTYSVDSTNLLYDKQIPAFQPIVFGTLNSISMKTGFDPISGEYKGDTFLYKDGNSLSRNSLPRIMKIEPRSEWATLSYVSIPYSDVISLSQAWLGVLGRAYTVIDIQVSISAINCLVGSLIDLSISQIPNQLDGGRGISNVPAIVLGRAVYPSEGYVKLKVIATSIRIAGYAPSSTVDSVMLNSGITYNISLINPSDIYGYSPVTDWEVGDVIELRQNFLAAPKSAYLKIIYINPYAYLILADKISGDDPAMIGSGTNGTIEYAPASMIQDSQKRYCYIAGADNIIDFSIPKTARQFS